MVLVGLPVSFEQHGSRGGRSRHLGKRRTRIERSLPGRVDGILVLQLQTWGGVLF